MGVWGEGLYANDLAMDLRATIAAVLRLPFDTDKVVDIVCGTQPSAVNNAADEEYAIFWLVMADQFSKRGIACDRVRAKALEILDARGGSAELRTRINTPPAAAKPRKVLREPEPLLMHVGDVLVYPTCDGQNINPYLAAGRRPFSPNGWGAIVMMECGRAFDYLAWYRPATLAETRDAKPTLNGLRGPMLWNLSPPGTCSTSHFRKMELQKIGMLPVDPEKAVAAYPVRFRSEVAAAVQDISIANSLKSARPGSGVPNHDGAQRGRCVTLASIDGVLVS
jgi:hypothetical protein